MDILTFRKTKSVSVLITIFFVMIFTMCSTFNFFLPKNNKNKDSLLIFYTPTIQSITENSFFGSYNIYIDNELFATLYPGHIFGFFSNLKPGQYTLTRIEATPNPAKDIVTSTYVDLNVSFTIYEKTINIFPVCISSSIELHPFPEYNIQYGNIKLITEQTLSQIQEELVKLPNFTSWEDYPVKLLEFDGIVRPITISSRQRQEQSATCFTKDTIVKTELGDKKIVDIQVNDKVLSYNPKDKLFSFQPVIQTHIHNFFGTVIKINIENEFIFATYNHPFLVSTDTFSEYKWVDAEKLKPGDLVINSSGDLIQVQNVYCSIESIDVYNLTVANNHTYSVGESGIVVHNKGSQE